MTHLYLIRHGRQLSADAPDDQLIPEDRDVLSDHGLDQAQRLGTRLAARLKLDRLYASPIARARQTAEAIGAATGLPIQFDDRLREIHLNLPADMALNQIMDVWLATRRQVDRAVFAGGESFQDLQCRAVQAIGDILAAQPDGRVAIVTHGGVIETLCFHFLGVPIERNLQVFINIHHTGVFHWRRFTFREYSGWELLAANDIRHLD